MAFLLKPAVRDEIKLLFAISGASGSGKTYSALLLAQGIAGENGKIAVIDTEAGRASQYAPRKGELANPQKGTFNFEYIDLPPPFSPELYIEAIEYCEQKGATVIVIDSASHEWSGAGGVLETAEHDALRRATDKKGNIDYNKLNSVKLLSWAEPKKRHKQMMAKLTRAKSHIIFCLRAEEKIKMGRLNGETKIIPCGYQPICEKNFMFEMTASLTMTPVNPGCPDYSFEKKLNKDLQSIFANEKLITIEHGQRLRQWAETGDIHISTTQTTHADNLTLQSKQPAKSKLECDYERLSHALSKVNSLQDLQKITSNKFTIELRKELATKKPSWAGTIDHLIKQTTASLHQEEMPPQGQFDDGQGVMRHAS